MWAVLSRTQLVVSLTGAGVVRRVGAGAEVFHPDYAMPSRAGRVIVVASGDRRGPGDSRDRGET